MTNDAVLRVSPEVHRQVKATAALYNMSLKEFTEKALRKYILPDLKTLVDQKPDYETEEQPCTP